MYTTLGENETYRYNLKIGPGITVSICVSNGSIEIYASSDVPNPNSAIFDFHLDLNSEDHEGSTERCGSMEISDPDTLSWNCRSGGIKRSLQEHQMARSDRKTDTVYISIVGRDQENRFVLNNTRHSPSKSTVNPSTKGIYYDDCMSH